MQPAPGGYRIEGVRLAGVVSTVPARRLENQAFEDRLGEAAVADVAKMTGVQTRYWVEPGQTTADLCQAAAERLIERLAWDRASIDGVIFVSQTPDHALPASACLLHGKLGLSPHAQAFDVGMGCSGYVYGLWLASCLLQAGLKRVLLLAGDTISPLLDPDDRATAVLFGDAGSATALERDAAAAPLHFRLGTDGTGATDLIVQDGGFRSPCGPAGAIAPTLKMDGNAVFAFTLRAVPALIEAVRADAGLTAEDVDFHLLHQANQFMLRHIGKKAKAPPERLPINIGKFGNTSSATLPLLLTDAVAERLSGEAATLVLAGFGVGYSWGAVAGRFGPLDCAETLYL